MGLWVYVLIGVMVSVGAPRRAPLLWCETQELLASDADTFDWMGYAVSVSGDVSVVGAYRDEGSIGFESGSAYVFRFDGSTWTEEQKLVADDGAPFDQFGRSVSVFGNVIVIGAPLDDDNGMSSGSAYVFRYDGSTWNQEQKFANSDGADSDEFGRFLDVSGGLAVVGAWADDDNGSFSGSAYVFRYDGSTWIEEEKLVASDGQQFEVFGRAVAVDNDVIVVGVPEGENEPGETGSAYVFRYDGTKWTEEQKLLAPDGANLDRFGHAVSVSSDVVLIGSSRDDDNGLSSGSAYVFRYDGSTWVHEQKLLPSDGAEHAQFGESVSLSGNVALIGAVTDDGNGIASGAAYIFRYDGSTWFQERKLLSSDGAPEDFFGRDVSLSDEVAVVGAYAHDAHGAANGSAYVFTVCGCALDCDGSNDGMVGIADFLAMLSQWGMPGAPCDINGGGVGITDFLALLANWGPCP